MAITEQDIRNRMNFHRATPEMQEEIAALRAALIEAAIDAVALTPTSREQSLMVTCLEEALMWGSKSIVSPGLAT